MAPLTPHNTTQPPPAATRDAPVPQADGMRHRQRHGVDRHHHLARHRAPRIVAPPFATLVARGTWHTQHEHATPTHARTRTPTPTHTHDMQRRAVSTDLRHSNHTPAMPDVAARWRHTTWEPVRHRGSATPYQCIIVPACLHTCPTCPPACTLAPPACPPACVPDDWAMASASAALRASSASPALSTDGTRYNPTAATPVHTATECSSAARTCVCVCVCVCHTCAGGARSTQKQHGSSMEPR